jgi:transposase
MISDARGTPLAVSLTGGNRHDVTQLIPLTDAVPRVGGQPGRPRHRPDAIYADRAYDDDKYRSLLRNRRITPVIARRGDDHGTGLGVFRWVIERSLGWLHWPRRLRTRWERRADIHDSLLQLATCLIQHRRAQQFC